MISVMIHKWLIILLVSLVLSAPQYPMLYGPMLPRPPQPIQMPVPVPVPFSVPIPIPVLIEMKVNDSTTTTTTTTEKPKVNYTLFIPLSIPFPMGIPGPPPVIMIPFPPANIYKVDPSAWSASGESSKASKSSKSSKSSSSDSDDSSNSDSSSSASSSSSRKKKRRRKKNRRYGVYRRYYRRANDESAQEELKPVLNYISKNGDVKLRRQLSKQDAALLLQKELSPQPVHRVHVMVGDDSKEKSRLKVVAETANVPNKGYHEKKQIVMRRSAQQLVNSNKELVFKPPSNKKISNISISFNVAR